MIRGTFANIRLRNQLLDDVSRAATPATSPRTDGPQAFIYDAAQNYAAQAFRWSCSAARSTAPAPRATGRPRAPPARRPGGHRRVLRAHPPLQPDRHGRAPAAVPGGRVGGFAGTGRHRDRSTSPASRRSTRARRRRRCTSRRAKDDDVGRGSSSTRWCASTPPARPTTTATAASCSTCCATCSSRASSRAAADQA